MAQTPQTPGKKQRIQTKVFDVASGEELASSEHIIPVNGGGFCCTCCTHPGHSGCIMAAPPPSK
jgi:hypothetical protein